jgi:hypothetical protein
MYVVQKLRKIRWAVCAKLRQILGYHGSASSPALGRSILLLGVVQPCEPLLVALLTVFVAVSIDCAHHK